MTVARSWASGDGSGSAVTYDRRRRVARPCGVVRRNGSGRVAEATGVGTALVTLPGVLRHALLLRAGGDEGLTPLTRR